MKKRKAKVELRVYYFDNREDIVPASHKNIAASTEEEAIGRAMADKRHWMRFTVERRNRK